MSKGNGGRQGAKFSIKELIVHGNLGGVHAGMDRHEVRACLGEPDDWSEPPKGPQGSAQAPIWRYGNFEIHFTDDEVVMLFLDYLEEPSAGRSRAFDAWILQGTLPRTLEALRDTLTRRQVEYREAQDATGAPVLRVSHGADLAFDNPAGEWVWSAIVVRSGGSRGLG